MNLRLLKRKFFGVCCIIYKFYIFNINRKRLKYWLSTRKVHPNITCKGCGACCIGYYKGYFTLPCPNLDLKEKTCSVWKDIDYACKSFPFFPLQLKATGVEHVCKYYWEKKK